MKSRHGVVVMIVAAVALRPSVAFTQTSTNIFQRNPCVVCSASSSSEGWTAQSSWGSSSWSSEELDSLEISEMTSPTLDIPSEAERVPGNYGFDPLNLQALDFHVFSATDGAMQVLRTENFLNRPAPLVSKDYRDAELRHGRLAMLAAVAWPLQELFGPALARGLNRRAGLSALSDALAETAGRSPSVLNGGLAHGWLPLVLFGAAACAAAVEVRALRLRGARGDAFVPGDLGFDPLYILQGADPDNAFKMRQLEVDHGRLAMLAVAAYVVEEAATHRPVTDVTPQLFAPLFMFPSFRAFFDYHFGAASAVGHITSEATPLVTEAAHGLL